MSGAAPSTANPGASVQGWFARVVSRNKEFPGSVVWESFWPVCVSNKGADSGRGLAKLTRHANQLAVQTALFQQLSEQAERDRAQRHAELLERLRFEQLVKERQPKEPEEPEEPEGSA